MFHTRHLETFYTLLKKITWKLIPVINKKCNGLACGNMTMSKIV